VPNSVRNHVIRLLSRKTGLAEADIYGSDELVTGLGLDGDDAGEFFEDLRRHFGTDLSALETDWSRYFRPEPTLLSAFGFGRRRTLDPITVEEVVHAVERGMW
jgi:hypothetical protein